MCSFNGTSGVLYISFVYLVCLTVNVNLRVLTQHRRIEVILHCLNIAAYLQRVWTG